MADGGQQVVPAGGPSRLRGAGAGTGSSARAWLGRGFDAGELDLGAGAFGQADGDDDLAWPVGSGDYGGGALVPGAPYAVSGLLPRGWAAFMKVCSFVVGWVAGTSDRAGRGVAARAKRGAGPRW